MDKKKNTTAKRKAVKEQIDDEKVKGKKEKKESKSVTKKKENKKEEEEQKAASTSPKKEKKTKEKKVAKKANSKKEDVEEIKETKTDTTVVANKKASSPKIKTGTKEIRIYSWNVNGIRAVQSKGNLEEFVKNENPDIFCLNETKIDHKKLNELKLNELYKESYTSYWNCSEKAGYAGVSIFTKITPISVTNGIGIPKHDDEGKNFNFNLGRVITLEFENFYLVSVYIPNAGEGLKNLEYRTKEWDVDFAKFLQNLRQKKNVVLTGDLNVAHQEIDISNPKANKKSAGFTLEEREGFTKLLDAGYVDTFRKLYPEKVQYSYWSARTKARETNKGWRLDYFIVNKEAEGNVKDSEILDTYMGSDHCPIKLTYLA